MVFRSRTEQYILLVTILIFSSMGVSLYVNCGMCDNDTSKKLYHAFLSWVVISAAVIATLFAYQYYNSI